MPEQDATIQNVTIEQDQPSQKSQNEHVIHYSRPNKEEILAAIRETTAKLGYVPNYPELKAATGIARQWINRCFANYSNALKECGIERGGPGYMAPIDRLYLDFAGIVRKLGHIPTSAEYEIHSRYTCRPLARRFGSWRKVAAGMLHYAEQADVQEEWQDVVEVLKNYCRREAEKNKTSSTQPCTTKSRILADRPVYGPLLTRQPMANAPTNEMGVLFLFGAMAVKLGFCILWLGSEFPDGEALREVEPDRWQRVRIEFEFQSRNFQYHGHDAAKCDLIVCWEDNWKESPLDVLELKGAMDRSPESP
jgi:hypothetical protein